MLKLTNIFPFQVENFVPSKSQRKVARRFFNFMMHGRGDDKLGRGHHAELAALITMDNVLKFKDDEVDRFWQRVEVRRRWRGMGARRRLSSVKCRHFLIPLRKIQNTLI